MSRALVLSGGGSVGIAWQTGWAAGLQGNGVDLAEADFIVGTSAGSAVGAQIALGFDMTERVARYQEVGAARAEASAAAGSSPRARGADDGAAGGGAGGGMQGLMAVMAGTGTTELSPEERRARIGKFALEAETAPEESFVRGFSYLADRGWPRRYACTAVDALNGEFVVWDAAKAAPLERAVASSCAVPGRFPPITIDGRRYIDGGMRSGTNADLAKGYDLVLIVSLRAGARGAAPTGDAATDQRMERMRRTQEAERASITEAGGSIELVGPDEEAAPVLGGNLMDGSNLPAIAEAGLAQGRRDAARLAAIWK